MKVVNTTKFEFKQNNLYFARNVILHDDDSQETDYTFSVVNGKAHLTKSQALKLCELIRSVVEDSDPMVITRRQ